MEQGPAHSPGGAPAAEAQLRALIGERRFQDAMALDLTFFCSAQETDQKHADDSIDVPSLLAAVDSLAH